MGLYRRKWRNSDGKLITNPQWWMSGMVDGRQVCKPTGVTNKRTAQQIYDAWRAEIAQGQFNLLKKAPKLKEWAEKYLKTVDHPNTRRRYESSKENLVSFFGEGAQLDHLSTARIEQFKQQRREEGVKGSTINRDLRFLAQILKQAERERCLARSPFDLTKFFLNESRDRRKPHILTWEEQEKLLAVASPRLRGIHGPWGGDRDADGRNAQTPMEGHRLFERCDTGGTQQNIGRNQGRPNFGSLQDRTITVAESCRTGIFRVGIPQFRKPSASVTARWPEGVGEHIEESGTAIFPDLLLAAHFCLPVDGGRRIAAHDCADAGTFIHTDRSQVCTGNGPEPARCDEEIGRAEKIGNSQPKRT